MDEAIRALIDRLAGKGLELSNIPAYIRNLAHSISADPFMTLEEINGQMESLGWGELRLDSHTCQLLLAVLADGGVMEYGRPFWQLPESEPGRVPDPDLQEHPPR